MGDLGGGALHGQKAGLSIRSGRRPHADEDHGCVLDGLARFGCERQATGSRLPRERFLESGLVEGWDPLVQERDPLPVDVASRDVMADGGERDARDQTDVARTDDSYLHSTSLLRADQGPDMFCGPVAPYARLRRAACRPTPVVVALRRTT